MAALNLTQPSRRVDLLAQFVRRIWSRHRRGHVFLAARRPGQWVERCFPIDGDGIEAFFTRYWYRRHDLYYCPNSFSRRRRLGVYALPTPYAHCDIDAADPSLFQPPPTLLTETSPGRYQGIWEFVDAVAATRAEAVSRHLTRQYGGDPGGWSATKMLRIPGTLNHKDEYDLPLITIVRDLGCALAAWPNVSVIHRQDTKAPGAATREPAEYDAALARLRQLSPALTVDKRSWLMVHLMQKRDVPWRPGAQADGVDRSRIMTIMILRCRSLGLAPEETFSLCWRSGWCKFRVDQRRDGVEDLWHEIEKAYGE